MDATRSSSGPKAKRAKLTHRSGHSRIGGLATRSTKPLSAAAPPARKGPGFADLPPELHLMIWEMAMDLPASVITVGTRLSMYSGQQQPQGTPDRAVHLERPDTNLFNRQRWARAMGREFFHARRAVEKVFGTPEEYRDDKLRSVRRNKDIALYIFRHPVYINYSWGFGMDKDHNRRHMGPGVQNVALLWDHLKSNAFRCYESRHKHGRVNICPDEFASFLDHFASLKHMYFLVLLRISDTRCRTKSGLISKMSQLIALQKKRPDLARFEDTDRLWIEADEQWARNSLKETVMPIFRVIRSAEARLMARPALRPREERKQIKFHVLVSSWYKEVSEKP